MQFERLIESAVFHDIEDRRESLAKDGPDLALHFDQRWTQIESLFRALDHHAVAADDGSAQLFRLFERTLHRL